MSLELISDRIAILKDRSEMLGKVRAFFQKLDIMEVDVPILSRSGSIDLHIDLVEASVNKKRAYLHSSPEYGMKRLLSEGVGDIYQLSHVFRDGESGLRHQVEFTMIEWYRTNFSMEELIEETLDLLRLFIDCREVESLTYEEAFMKYVGRDFREVKDRDLTFANDIEPHLGNHCFTILFDFPAEDAALSQVLEKNGKKVAARFEVLFEGMELANGYLELINYEEQKLRLSLENQKRREHQKCEIPIDYDFLSALEKGLPPSAGVAVGFDRLMMLRHGVDDIREVVSIPWE